MTNSTTHLVREQVCELIRQRNIDPFKEPTAVRQLIDESLAAYAERTLAGTLPLIADHAELAETLFHELAGVGPLQPFLDDPTVEEIWINGPGRVFVAREGRSELTTVVLTADRIADLVERMLSPSGRRLDLSHPFVDAPLPDGSRLHVVIPDITREHWAVNIRKFVVHASTLDDLAVIGALTSQAARFLDAAVVAGLNIVVAGGTQAGKTTLLGCLASAIPATERVVSCEEVFELKIDLPDWVAMQTRNVNVEGAGEVDLRRLIVEALRMRPSRIIVGEVRQAECLDLLIALNAGLPGMCTIHANSAREALTKLCTLPLLAGENISSAFIVPTVARAVDLIVYIDLDSHGNRHVTEIVGLSGHVESTTIETSTIFESPDGSLVRGQGFPPGAERFARAGYDLPALLAPGDA